MRTKLALLAAVGCGIVAGPALADQISLSGVVRDFKRGDWSGGHPDFETAGSKGAFGHVVNMTGMDLGEDGKPVYQSDRKKLYSAGSLSTTKSDTMKSKSTFAQWYKDTPGVNLSMPLTLTLDNGQAGKGGVYTYQNNSFWPINSQGFGNESLNKNFHFTFELRTTFSYAPGQVFTFIGDDDVWVYINGKKVIDIGGVHGATTASVVLFDGKAFVEKGHFYTTSPVKSISSSMATEIKNKWDAAGLGSLPSHLKSGGKYIDLGLTNDQDCTLDFFFAERHTTQSNFRIDTSISSLKEVPPTTISPLYD